MKVEEGIRRRHRCGDCKEIFPSYQIIGVKQLMVKKSDGRLQKFDPEKIKRGIELAYYVKGFEIEDTYLGNMTDYIVNKIRGLGKHEVSSREIGQIVLKVLASDSRDESKVAFVRYASVFMAVRNTEGLNRLVVQMNQMCQDGGLALVDD
jgi:transcriptional repressor NrdR